MVDNMECLSPQNLKRFESKRVKNAYKKFCYENGYNCASDMTIYNWINGVFEPSATNKEILIDFFNQYEK